jgi:maleate isomerase
MVVPSLNTIAEDDFRLFCPDEVSYHVHRIRLRKESGRVTMDSLLRAWLEAGEESEYLKDLSPDAVVFNCTGASVAHGATGDALLAQRLGERLGVPATNTMVAIKEALQALRADRILHVCPFADEFSRIERESLEASGHKLARTISLGFTDAKEAALMTPQRIAGIVREQIGPDIGAVLLSCANVRAFEAAAELEAALGLPVVTSNQATLWAVLRLVGWHGQIAGAGSLFAGH